MPEPHKPTAARGKGRPRASTSPLNASGLSSSFSSSDSNGSSVSAKRPREMQEELPREPSSDNGSDVDCSNIEECIGSMVAQRDQLRRRFKEWANDIDYTAKRMRCITNNALVNQSTRLEQILSDGKTRIDGIVGDQSRIRDQLASFVSILSNAQSQIFGDLNDHMPFADSSKPCTDALPPAAAPSATHLKRRQTRDGSHA